MCRVTLAGLLVGSKLAVAIACGFGRVLICEADSVLYGRRATQRSLFDFKSVSAALAVGADVGVRANTFVSVELCLGEGVTLLVDVVLLFVTW